MIHPANFHYIDTVWACRGNRNKLAAYIGAGPMELVAFQWSDNKNRNAFASHAKCHQLHSKGLTCSAGSQNRHISVLVNCRIKDIYNDERAVVFIDTQQNPVVITHLITRKGVAAGCAACKKVTFTALIQFLFRRNQRQRRQKRLLATKMAVADVHIL